MIFDLKKMSRMATGESSPLNIAMDEKYPHLCFVGRSKKPKLNIKIGKYKLPKDFFSCKSTSKIAHTRKRKNTDREVLLTPN